MLSCLSVKRNLNMSCKITTTKTGIILCIRPANMRWRYIVTSSLIGWAHTQNDPCKGPMMGIYGMSFISTKSDLLTVTTKCSGSFRNRICPFVCLSFHMSIPKQACLCDDPWNSSCYLFNRDRGWEYGHNTSWNMYKLQMRSIPVIGGCEFFCGMCFIIIVDMLQATLCFLDNVMMSYIYNQLCRVTGITLKSY